MKLSFTSAGSFLLATSAIADQVLRDGLVDGERLARRPRQIVPNPPSWTQPNYCSETGQIADMESRLVHPPPPNTLDYSSLCSEVLRPTSTISLISTLAGTTPILLTSTTTTTLLRTTSDLSRSTTTALCPKPTSSQRCGIQALGYQQNKLYSQNNIDGMACHELCLADKRCKSFQVVLQDNADLKYLRCNIYSTGVKGNVVESPGGAVFYDRGCGDLLPAGCAKSPHKPRAADPTITRAPELLRSPPSSENKEVVKRDYTLPAYLAGYFPLLITFACSCLVTSAAAPVTSTETEVVQMWSYSTTTSTKSEVYSFTEHPNWNTVYKTVA